MSHLEGQDLVVVTQHQQEIHKDCAGFWLSRTTVRIIDCRFAAMEHLWPVTLFPFPPAGVTVRLGQSLGVHTSQCLLRFCLSHFTTSPHLQVTVSLCPSAHASPASCFCIRLFMRFTTVYKTIRSPDHDVMSFLYL